MSTIVETTVYQFAELSESAKEKAREWYREVSADDNDFADTIIEDAKEAGALMGIDVDRVYYSGFWSQGDGACFEGSCQYRKGALKAIEAAYGDKELIAIAKELQAIQRRNFYRLRATVKQRGHYNHSGCTEVEVWDDWYQYRDLGDDYENVRQVLRDFMDWIYSRLEAEYEYQNADEQVDESIEANEYTFTESGRRF